MMFAKEKYAPIVLFVYNRLWHTEQTVAALKENELSLESDLYIFSDGPKVAGDENVKIVREYIKTISGFKSISIIERENNLGLANSIISGVTEIINEFGRIIVLEDDLITSRYFLKFMNEALQFFNNKKDIFSISGFTYPAMIMKIPENYDYDIYLSHRFGSWGWGSWKDRWDKVDWEVKDYNKFKSSKKMQDRFNCGGSDLSNMLTSQMEGDIDSWAIRFDYSHFINNCYNVRPCKSLVNNIGFDNSGVHCGENKAWETSLNDSSLPEISEVPVSHVILENFRKIFDFPKQLGDILSKGLLEK